MPNSNGWGDGTANNTIGWGQGSINNTIGWGSAYAVSEAGLTDIIGSLPAPPAFAFTAKTDNTGVSTPNSISATFNYIHRIKYSSRLGRCHNKYNHKSFRCCSYSYLRKCRYLLYKYYRYITRISV
jgi:hypothetical protein